MTIYLKDYKAPDFLVAKINLFFDIYESFTIVKADLHIKRNGHHKRPLILNGDELDLLAVFLDGESVIYKQNKESLIIKNVPDSFKLQTEVKIKPQENTQLDGLYKSKNIFCTQCEPHGFRRITYFPDRPDVMSQFNVTICAAEKKYPVLLSNGNLIAKGKTKNHRHWVTWRDPSLKPCYLFALVAGDLEHISDKFITKSGRKVALRIYSEKGYKNQCRYAMQSLKKAMAWDEQVFGREYDLDIYMIVAIGDFNMGAMENKGLNIFNSKYVFVDKQTATDEDYINVEHVVAHEYFHNWTGNRVTCRDWFQLSLKEGLTVFRDQLFSEALHPVMRIKNIDIVRSQQFAEDASSIAHPVRPKSYISMNNFYTLTVYNKGAEIIRMLHTILGPKKFRKGMDLYFKRHDGQAVTIDDFVQALQDASNIDLNQFKKWYDTSGTPVLDIKSTYNARTQVFNLTVKQNRNFHIPLAVALLDKKGKNSNPQILNIKNKTENFKFKNIKAKPLPSLLRNFSAPVKLNYSYTNDDLMFLMQHDEDNFARWNAGQNLAVNIILSLIKDYQNNKKLNLVPGFINAFKNILHDNKSDQGFIALMLTLPSTAYIIELMDIADVDAIFNVYEFIKSQLAKNLQQDFLQCYKAAKERSLKNLCLYYLMYLKEQNIIGLAMHQFNTAKNMTDTIGSLRALVDIDAPERAQALAAFYKKWQHEDLVINKWLELQALSKLPDTLENVKSLLKHKAFNIKNPNKVYALIRTFCKSNQVRFHDKTGKGYKFAADQILKIDKLNPQVAASIAGVFSNCRKFDKNRRSLMKEQMQRIKNASGLSKNVHEIIAKSLDN